MAPERTGIRPELIVTKGLYGIENVGIYSKEFKTAMNKFGLELGDEKKELNDQLDAFDYDSVILPVFLRITPPIERAFELEDFRSSLGTPQGIDDKEGKNEDEKMRDFYDASAYFALQAGLFWETYKSLSEAISIVSKNDQNAKKHLELVRFKAANIIMLRIAGLSIVDVARSNGDKIEPHKFFEFLLQSALIASGKSAEHDIEENLGRMLFKDYPVLTTCTSYVTSSMVNGLYFAGDKVIDGYKDPKVDVPDNFRKFAKSLVAVFQENSEVIQETLLNPESPYFNKLKASVEAFLSTGGNESKIAEYLIFNGSQEYLKELYRVCLSEVTSGTNRDFYGKLIKPLIDHIENSTDLLVSGDAELFFDKANGAIPPTIKELEEKALSIGNLSKNKQFDVDPATLDLKGIVKPASITLNINPYNPRRFTVSFHYVGENQESETIEIYVNSKEFNEGLEWSFIELPSMLPEVRDSLLNSTFLVLASVEKDLKDKKANKAAQKTKSMVGMSVKKTVRIKPIEPEVKSTKRKATRSQQEVPAIVAIITESEIKKEILISDDKSFRRMLDKLDPEDRKAVREGISDFNERGVGRFKRTFHDYEGNNTYSLRVRAKAPAGIRVIVIETQSISKKRRFEVVQIGYRRDVYRKLDNRI